MTLPNFMIIGAPKAGTTSIYRYLYGHPDVFMSTPKEPKFFAYDPSNQNHKNFPVKSMNAYKSLYKDVKAERWIGEASVHYLASEVAFKNILETLPESKLIISLRNPVDRAYSDYQMAVRNGRTKLGVADAFHSDAPWVRQGFRYDSIKRYLQNFPRENIKVVLFEHLKNDTTGVINEIYEFLNLDTAYKPDLNTTHNPGGVYKSSIVRSLAIGMHRNPSISRFIKKSIPHSIKDKLVRMRNSNLVSAEPLNVEQRLQLKALYRDEIDRLEIILEQDLSVWRD